MKKLPVFLILASLALNVTLACLLALGLNSPSSSPSEPTAATLGSIAPAEQPAIDPDVWPSMQTNELSALVTRLRATGFPPEVIRAIVSAQLSETFIARRKALDPDEDNRPFWKNRPPDPKRDLALRQLSREHEKTLRDLLGDDANADPMSQAYQQRRLADLPPEKVDDVRRLLREYDDQRADLYVANGSVTPNREKIAALDKAQRAALAQLLTPAELTTYDLRNSNTATQLRYELTAFNATEAEFRQLFQLRQPFDERFSNTVAGQRSPEELRARSEAQKQLTEQIKAALGPVRGEEYVRATDYNYRETTQLVARLELPPESTNHVYAVQKDIQQRSQALNADREMPADQRAQQIAALAEEAKTKITATLGDRGFEAYKQYGGQWMQSLQPRPAPRPVLPGAADSATPFIQIR